MQGSAWELYSSSSICLYLFRIRVSACFAHGKTVVNQHKVEMSPFEGKSEENSVWILKWTTLLEIFCKISFTPTVTSCYQVHALNADEGDAVASSASRGGARVVPGGATAPQNFAWPPQWPPQNFSGLILKVLHRPLTAPLVAKLAPPVAPPNENVWLHACLHPHAVRLCWFLAYPHCGQYVLDIFHNLFKWKPASCWLYLFNLQNFRKFFKTFECPSKI